MIKRVFQLSILFLSVLLLTTSCDDPEPRYPVKVSSGVDYSGSIELSKRINQKEEKRFRQYMETHDMKFDRSPFGFLYIIENKKRKPKLVESGDYVKYSVIIENLNGMVLYQEQTKSLKVDHQEEIKGMHEGLKLMSKGATATFIFPSHQAYGFHGDEKKIKPNTPLIYRVKVLDVVKKKLETAVVDSTKIKN